MIQIKLICKAERVTDVENKFMVINWEEELEELGDWD